jgi:choline dehydrogenase-like flavoprotein/diketogulonate reductase-like aldo/keto reductase
MTLGAGLGRPLPRLVLGTAHLSRMALEAVPRLLDHAVQRGVTALDTAAVYGLGEVERRLGRWLAASGARDQLILIGKGGHPDEGGSHLRADRLGSDLVASLDRLGVSQVDLYLAHRDDPDTPVAELVDALDEQVRAGRARPVGVSNWTVPRLRAALEYAAQAGRAPLVASSVQLSLAVPRTPPWPGCETLSGHGREHDRAWYREARMPLLAWSPLAGGFLAAEPPRASPGPTAVYDHPANQQRRARAASLARDRGVELSSIALAWVLGEGPDVHAIVGCGSPDTLDRCLTALTLELSPQERRWLLGEPLATPAPARRAQFDAIVIGSGATGGWAAKELTEAGLDVLVLDAGPEHDPVSATRSPPARHAPSRQHIQSLHPHHARFPAELFVDDLEHPYTYPPGSPFAWIRGRQVGGRSLTWGGITLRLSDFELAAASADGHGIDWPLRHADLAPHYARVEEFLGVRGNRDGLPQLPDGAFLPPTPLTSAELTLRSVIQDAWPDRTLLHARGIAHDQLAANGWPLLSSPGSTLAAARDTGRLTLRANAVVQRILVSPDGRRARGVTWVDRTTGAADEAHGRLIVLCAGTIESTRLLLASQGSGWTEGLGNSSGVLGRYLMDHPWFHVIGSGPEPDGPLGHPAGGPFGAVIPRFRNLGRRDLDAVRGYGISCSAQRGGLHGPATSGFVVQLEMLPSPENRVELEPSVRDPWGVPVPRVTCTFDDNVYALAEDALDFLSELADLADLAIDQHQIALFPPGLFVHEVGTARMGADPRTSFLNPWNQSWELPNLLVTDGSCFPSSGWQNPTLTMMALTVRACAHAVSLLRGGELSAD